MCKDTLKFKLQGRNYIRCNALTKKPRHTKRPAAAEDTPAEPSEPIELDLDGENDSDDDAQAAFEDIKDIKAIEVEDKGDSILD